jgi:NADPH-dependent curcumin reductase CurA
MDTFELVESEVPDPGPHEVLVRSLYMSVDPYMRGRMRDVESYAEPWDVGDPMKAGVVGEVEASEHPDFEAGDVVTGQLDWADYSIAEGRELRPVNPDHGPISTAVGVLGMPGVTAYFGTVDVAEPKPGDTVVVSAAAGAVGSVVGQIADLNGCRVVGIAGSDEKIEWLESVGFDAGVNYKDGDVGSQLRETCPDGVDVYFDNVGGPVTDAVWPLLNDFSRVAVCGQISLYNASELPTGPRKLTDVVQSRTRVEGFIVSDYEGRWGEAFQRLAKWIASGEVEYRENVVEGLENAPDAFLALFEGDKIGKQLVQVGERSD